MKKILRVLFLLNLLFLMCSYAYADISCGEYGTLFETDETFSDSMGTFPPGASIKPSDDGVGCVDDFKLPVADGNRVYSTDFDYSALSNGSVTVIATQDVKVAAYFPGSRADIAAAYGVETAISAKDDMGLGKWGPLIDAKYVQLSNNQYYLEIDGKLYGDYMWGVKQYKDTDGEYKDFTIEGSGAEMRMEQMFTTGDGKNSLKPFEDDPNFGPDKVPDPEDPEEPEDTKNRTIDEGYRYVYYGVSTTPYVHMSPSPSASISSSDGKYNAEEEKHEGIPTSENLKYSLSSDEALYNIRTRHFDLRAGVRETTMTVSANYEHVEYFKTKVKNKRTGKWEEIWDSETTIETISQVVTLPAYEHSLSLYDVPVSNIYPVTGGSVSATKDGNTLSASIGLSGAGGPGADTIAVMTDLPKVKRSYSRNLGTYTSRAKAQNAMNAYCIGVYLEILGKVDSALGYTGSCNYSYNGLHVTTISSSGSPSVGQVSGSNTNMIPSTYPNGTYIGSGSVSYSSGRSFPAIPNNVVVHTPVVNRATISDISEFINQKIVKDPNKKYLMLDEEFSVTIPNDGTHNSFKGYGTRIYNSGQGVTRLSTTWGKIKDVKLPFDVYVHYKQGGNVLKKFVRANTWLSESEAKDVLELTGTTFTFTVPVWVTEKDYEIETRVIAENAVNPSMYSLAEEGHNSSNSNYVATKKIPVEVIGKIYDLRVSACNDPGWANIHSAKTGKDYIAAKEFPFGQQGQNRVVQYKYAPKLGYTFVFDFKTKGRKSNNIDVSIQPEGFYFVGRDGNNLQEVDLYYNTTTKQNVQIRPEDSSVPLSVRLRDALYKVPAQEFVDSSRIYSNKYNYALSVKIGTFAKLNMPENLRLCYNNFAEYVNQLYGKGSTEGSISTNAGARDTVIGSVGHWYAGYRLPATTKAVPKGTPIATAIQNHTTLTDGYILVKFGIKTKYQTSGGNYEYLQYMGPEALNEGGNTPYTNKTDRKWTLEVDWTVPGGLVDTILPNGARTKVPVGTVAIYDASLRSSNDAEVGGTH